MHKKRVWLLPMSLLFIIGATIILPNVALAETGSTGMGISAGAAKIIITPDTDYIAATGVNDELHARCVVIYDWRIETTVVLVSLDLLGHMLTDITIPIRNEVEAAYGIDGDYVLVGATHTHASGVDVIGVYSGTTNPYIVDVYKPLLTDKVVEVIGLALDDMRRAVVQVGSVEVSGMTFNRRTYPEAGTTDDELVALRFADLEGETIATMVNFAVHPVITMTGTLVSADFCGYLCEELEDEFGGVGTYFNGAIGDINPYMYIGYDSPYAPDDPEQYVAAEEYGHVLAVNAIQALQNGRVFENLPVNVATATVDLPLENPGFLYLMMMGLINREVIPINDGYIIRTEVFVVKIGPIEMATIPGEAFVEIGLLLKETMAKYGFVIGLTPEELGYIVPLDQFDPAKYEESMDVCSETGQNAPLLTEALLELIAELE